MSKALPIAVAVILGGAALIPVYYATKHPEAITSKASSFLTENAKKPGVKTTASGLQYIITQEGTGKQPAADSVVTVHYTGKLVDGKVFDSSIQRGEPIEFQIGRASCRERVLRLV